MPMIVGEGSEDLPLIFCRVLSDLASPPFLAPKMVVGPRRRCCCRRRGRDAAQVAPRSGADILMSR